MLSKRGSIGHGMDALLATHNSSTTSFIHLPTSSVKALTCEMVLRRLALLCVSMLAIWGQLTNVAWAQTRVQRAETAVEAGRDAKDETDHRNANDEVANVESDNSDEDEDDEDDEEDEEDEDARTELLGERWHRMGPVVAECFYSGQLHNNARGGISTQNATRYRGNLELGLRLNTDQAQWWEGGEFFVYAQSSHGQTLTQDFVGDSQFYNNFDTSPRAADLTQLGEYWYRHSWGETGSVQLGRQDANEHFCYADLGGDFINSSFLTLPNIPLPTWPTQTLGVSSLLNAGDRLTLGGGAYDQGRDIGQWWVTHASRGMFFIAQADVRPFADYERSLPTTVRLGSWFTSADTEALDGGSVFDGNYGFYTTVDRLLFRENAEEDQGLGVFFQASWAPPDRNELDQNYGAGLVYRGLLSGRDADTLGLGFSLVEFSHVKRGLTGQTSENAIETFYKAQVTPWLSVQPDLQYIVRPSGIERDALVVGLAFSAAF
ncbi:MAG: carbohydrate porin [Pirellulaceae bacterium]|nr:carbohydrate porin [Pirellulaceae bacterium]